MFTWETRNCSGSVQNSCARHCALFGQVWSAFRHTSSDSAFQSGMIPWKEDSFVAINYENEQCVFPRPTDTPAPIKVFAFRENVSEIVSKYGSTSGGLGRSFLHSLILRSRAQSTFTICSRVNPVLYRGCPDKWCLIFIACGKFCWGSTLCNMIEGLVRCSAPEVTAKLLFQN